MYTTVYSLLILIFATTIRRKWVLFFKQKIGQQRLYTTPFPYIYIMSHKILKIYNPLLMTVIWTISFVLEYISLIKFIYFIYTFSLHIIWFWRFLRSKFLFCAWNRTYFIKTSWTLLIITCTFKLWALNWT